MAENVDYFETTVPPGAVVYGKGYRFNGSVIPENALELWKNGSQHLKLKKEGVVLLESLGKEVVKFILEKRRPLGYADETKILNSFLRTPPNSKK